MRKKILIALIFLIYGLVWQYNNLISYGYNQAVGQLEVIYNAVPLNDVLNNADIDQSTKEKILLMQEVRQFAIDSIGLNDSDNYTSYYEQHDKDILWNLSACAPFKFEAKEWKIPILGAFSYKGFFDINAAKKEKTILDSLEFDTRIRPVSAWSTLGWFNDPILSNMLKRSSGSIAELTIHELTHSTIFVKDSLTYNENLASFIGEQGAIKFLISKYGIESNEYLDYKSSKVDYKKYTNHMLKGFQQLDSLYETFEGVNQLVKIQKKQELIQEIVDNIDSLSFKNKKRFLGVFDKQLPNNAYFQSYERYNSKLDEFEGILNNN